MADEQTQNQTPQGNEAEARLPTGELKDQTPSTPPSGQTNGTNTEQSQQAKPNDGKSFLNQTPESKSNETPPADGDDKTPPKGEEKSAEGAPEKYADFTLPEGYEFDADSLKAAQGLFKELNLTQAQSQKLIDMYAKHGIESTEAPYKLWADTQTEWVDKIQSDFGSKAETMRTEINKGIDAAFPPKLASAFREALDFTGAGSNPAMFEAFHTLFKPFLEGTPVDPGRPSAEGQRKPTDTRPTAAEAIYPHLIKNRQ